MKIRLLICCMLIIASNAFSQQVSNGGFENWHSYTGYDMPDSFYTLDCNIFWDTPTTIKSTDAHSGHYAALLIVSNFAGMVSYGSFQKIGTTNYFRGWSFSGRPAKMKFWYKFIPAGNDTVMTMIGLTKQNDSLTTVGIGALYITSKAASYELAEIPITYLSDSNPDTIFISFMSGTYKSNPTPGTMFYIDDISLEYIEGVNETNNIIPNKYLLFQNFPNPFNPITTINYSIAKEGNVKITVYNTIGSKVATIVNEYKHAGNYSIQFNASSHPSGVYFYKLESGGYSDIKKLMVIK